MELLIHNALSPVVLIAIGIFLIAMEALTFTFILFWFGVSAILVGILSMFYIFTNIEWQVAAIGMVALLLLFALRAKMLKKFLNSKDKVKDDFLNTSGTGIVKNGKIYYKATYWDCDDIDSLQEGQKVEVLEAKRNIVKIK